MWANCPKGGPQSNPKSSLSLSPLNEAGLGDNNLSESGKLAGPKKSLPGGRFIKISISQVFRITDALISPKDLRAEARTFHRYITNHRRSRNSRRSFQIESLGELKPVGSQAEENGGFWRPAISTSYEKAAPRLLFVPFELSLSTRLERRRALLDSVLEDSLGTRDQNVVNRQISGRLRIYPTGVGVVRINIAIEFKEAIDVTASVQIARAFEQLLFVDAEGNIQPCETLLLDVIQSVTRFLFRDEQLQKETRWRPAETTYSLKSYHSKHLEKQLSTLAYLIAAAPGNEEERSSLEVKLKSAMGTSDWQLDGVLAIASQRSSLFLIIPSVATGLENSRKQKLEWLTETSELVWVTSYAAQAFIERISSSTAADFLESSFSSDLDGTLMYLSSLFETTRHVLLAIEAAQRDLRKLGPGVLGRIASDVWKWSNPVRKDTLRGALESVRFYLRRLDAPIIPTISGDMAIIEQTLARFSRTAWQPERGAIAAI